jgi:hypothetical protein
MSTPAPSFKRTTAGSSHHRKTVSRQRAAQKAACEPLIIEIGGLPLSLRAPDPEFRALLAARYSSFVRTKTRGEMEFDLRAVAPGPAAADPSLEVRCEQGQWHLSRGEFRASFDLSTRRGHLDFVPNPYSVDTLLRIVHSLLLAPGGGLLLHAAGGIRDGRGVLFSGVSGAGKSTIASLAPRDVQLLTDEISYLRREGLGFRVYGTPFSGELGIRGEDVSAPLSAIYLIEHGPANRLERVAESEAARRLMRNTLFFAREKHLVAQVFCTVCDLVRQVPVYRLEFVPDTRVWEMIR